jgi:DNA-directed RNA polymerase subunit RPC12/RpoP
MTHTDAEHRCAACGSPLNVRLLEAPGEESLYICSECDREFDRGLSGEFCQDC